MVPSFYYHFIDIALRTNLLSWLNPIEVFWQHFRAENSASQHNVGTYSAFC